MLSFTEPEEKLQESLKAYEQLHTNNKDYVGTYPPTKKQDAGFPLPQSDFHWETTDEPHRTRRKLILQKYPQIQELFGHCTRTKYYTMASVIAQFALAYYLKNKMWTLEYWLISYFVGATITHSLFLAIHEITHFLAFKSPNLNRYLAMIANLPIGIPYCIAFRGYHMEHHTLQGTDGIDTDLPTKIEGVLFSSMPALRPMLVRLQKFTSWHLMNWAFQLAGMATMVYFWGPNPFLYFLTSVFLSGSLHPMAGHFIAEHYEFVKGYETYSYYGPLNMLAYNVGYHNEHHDFPRIPCSRLPLVRKIAPEFYDGLPQVESWPMTIINFILFPHMTPYSRVKRKQKSN